MAQDGDDNVIRFDPGRVGVTDAARKLIEQLKQDHGPLGKLDQTFRATPGTPGAHSSAARSHLADSAAAS